MGEAKHNPMSPQFRGQYPDEMDMAALRAVRHPTPEWHAEHPNWRAEGLTPPDDQCLVSVMVVVKRVEPSALFPGEPHKWKSSADIPIGPVLFMQPTPQGEYEAVTASMPLAQFRQITPIGNGRAVDKEPPVMLEDEVSVMGDGS